MMNKLLMQLREVNEAVDMIEMQLRRIEDPQLEEQRDKLLEKRREIRKKLEELN